jgi:hypothetical protein
VRDLRIKEARRMRKHGAETQPRRRRNIFG